MFRFLRNHHKAINTKYLKHITHRTVTKNMKNRCASNIIFINFLIMFSYQLKHVVRQVANVLNWVLFDWSSCTVVLFSLILSVTQRNLRSRCKSRHVPYHSTAIMWIWEVWAYIEKRKGILHDAYPQKWYYLFGDETLKSKTQRGENFVSKYKGL